MAIIPGHTETQHFHYYQKILFHGVGDFDNKNKVNNRLYTWFTVILVSITNLGSSSSSQYIITIGFLVIGRKTLMMKQRRL